MGDARKHNTVFFEYNPADPSVGSGNSGKSWNEASGPGKFLEYVKLKENVWQTVWRINIEILGKKG